MKGLELSERYFNEFGKPMLEDQFASVLPFLAAGLCGSGSECYGFDDEVSWDHDFEPGFCIFLPGEEVVDRKIAFLLERAYAKLPKEFLGFKKNLIQPVGGSRHGVIRISDFFIDKTGTPDGNLSVSSWFPVSSTYLAEATNGKIFFDNYGELSRVREKLRSYPVDIKKKKLAAHLLLMSQSGQYNFSRCIRHGEHAAAQLAAFDFAKNALSAVFLLNDRYEPFYKWVFKALRLLPKLSFVDEKLERIISTDNSGDNAENKYYLIESVASDIIDELVEQELSKAICSDLEKHAYSVNDGISDPEIRNMHILAAV